MSQSPTVTDWLTAIGTVGTGALAVLLAIWGPGLRGVFFKPGLVPSIEMRPPDSHKLMRRKPDGSFQQGYYCRLRVTNKGNISARDVEVRLLSLERLTEDGTYHADPDFRPLNLKWSHVLTIVMPKVDPKLWKYCDLCHVWQDDPLLLNFDTEVEPVEVSPGVWPTRKGRGAYRIQVAITAANAPPVFERFKIRYEGVWSDEPQRMFDDGLVIST